MVADPSIQNRNAITGTSIHTEYAKLGLGFMLGNNDVKAGILRVKRYLNPLPYIGFPPEHPIFGESHVLKTVIAGNTSANLYSALRISPKCEMLIWEMKRYRWKSYTNKKLQYENNAYEEPHKKDDHATDALRYALMSQPDLFAESTKSDVGSTTSKINDALSQMGLDGDDAFGASYPLQRDVADPNGILEGTSGWTPANNLPNSNSHWEFDEHMGMHY
jgi:hypothetical protein